MRHDLEVINADTGEYQFEMKQAYLKNLDMTEAISVKQQFEENARKKAEYEAKRKAEMEERKAREEAEAQKVVQAGKQVVVEQQPEETQQEVEATVTEERKFTVSFKVYGTQKQLRELKEFLTSNNIEYGPIQ